VPRRKKKNYATISQNRRGQATKKTKTKKLQNHLKLFIDYISFYMEGFISFHLDK